jgi:shikimate kinase
VRACRTPLTDDVLLHLRGDPRLGRRRSVATGGRRRPKGPEAPSRLRREGLPGPCGIHPDGRVALGVGTLRFVRYWVMSEKVTKRRKQTDMSISPKVISEPVDLRSYHPETVPTMRRIFLAGVSCVGKTTIGAELAGLFGYRFYDLDNEVEAFYKLSIEHLQKRHKSMNDFRIAAAKVLMYILSNPESYRCVVALPPRGLMAPYWNVVRDTKATTVVIQDKPENILNRIAFFDVDSRPMKRTLSARERRLYLKEIKDDISYFRRSYNKATMFVDISGLDIEESARKIKAELDSDHRPRRHPGGAAPRPCEGAAHRR